MKRFRKITSLILTISLIVIIIQPNQVSAMPSKISTSKWAESEIKDAETYNLVVDELGDDYTVNIKRKDFCRLVVNMSEEIKNEELIINSNNPFNDTSNEDILKAYSWGIIKGISKEQFAPDNYITREQIAVILARAIYKLEQEKQLFFISDIDTKDIKFSDEEEISSWALKEIKLVNKYGIMKGIGYNKINPKGYITIEQAIIMIKRLYMEYYINRKEAKLNSNVHFIESKDVKLIDSEIISITKTGETTTSFTFTQLPKPFENIKDGDVFVLDPTSDNPFGYAGKVVNISNQSDGTCIINIEQPFLEEVFDEMHIDIDKELNLNNLIASNLPENTQVYCGLDPTLITSVASVGPGFGLEEVLKSFYANYNNNSYVRNLYIGFKKATIYDKDGDENTTEDQLKLEGKLTFKNPTIKSKIDFKGIKWNEFLTVFSTEQNFNINLSGGLSAEFSLGKSINQKRYGKELSDLNKVKLGPISAEGVDMGNTLVIGSLTFDIGTMTLIPKMGNAKKMPLAAVIMLTMDMQGKLNVNLNIGYNYEAYIKKGIDIVNKKYGKPINKGTRSYEDPLFYVEEYDITSSINDISKKPKSELYVQVKGEIKSNVTMGPEVGLMVCGIIPINMRIHGGLDSDIDGFDGKMTYDFNNSNLDFEGTIGKYLIKIGLFGKLVTRLNIKLDIPFTRRDAKVGFEYTKPWELIFKQIQNVELKVGDYLLFGSYYEEPILWQIIDKDNNNNFLLLSDKIIMEKTFAPPLSGIEFQTIDGESYFDAIKKTNADIHKIETECCGDNRWKISSIRKWLNSNESKVNGLHNYLDYADEPGFLTNFKEFEVNAIVDKKIKSLTNKKYRDGGGMSGFDSLSGWLVSDYVEMEDDLLEQPYEITKDKVFLPSILDICKYYNVNNKGIEKKVTQQVVDHFPNEYFNTENEESYMLRTSITLRNSQVTHIYKGYVTSETSAFESDNGIAPALYIENDFKYAYQKGDGTKENPYRY